MQDETKGNGRPNRLIKEKSPYLLQHAYNPVDWYPWCDEAFEKAKAEDKPVFVSIGYSSCHWCHVMENECFEDEEVAKLMNESFVCIKVDREERPDLDNAFMIVCQLMEQRCGWPLNVIVTPDKNPFFAASYIPKNSRFGLTGMMELIPKINDVWRTRRSELETVGQDIKDRIEAMDERILEEELGKEVLDDAYEKIALDFDETYGGFGKAPKFPIPHNLIFLIRYWSRTKENNALKMVEKTLQNMRLGGIFDQVGFGFHRYSTDKQWLVPHFEKMLYDQALLALAYTEAYQATGAEKFKATAKEVLEYTLRDLASPEGGFYASEDADSEDEEGKFYLWNEDEIRDALPAEDADLAIKIFGVESRGNYVEPGGKRSGENILHLAKSIEQVASGLNITVDEANLKLGNIQRILFKARQKRVRPARDDKVLTDWNGLMIAALAKASVVFGDPTYLQAAVKSADFILEKKSGEHRALFHRYAGGERAIDGFLDDYSFVVWGLIEIYQACFDEKYLQAALELTNEMISQFWDEKNGGFYFTSKSSKDVLPKRKIVYDGAIPSGNSVALLNLLRLARLSGDSTYEELVSKMMKTFAGEVRRTPMAYTFMLLGVDFAVGPAYNVILVGDPHDKDMLEMLRVLRRKYLPNLTISLRQSRETNATNEGVIYKRIENKATAYVCRSQTCMPPTNNPEKMLELLEMQ